MNYLKSSLFFLVLISLVACVETPQEEFNSVTVDELAANFLEPPVEYSLSFYWGWDGTMTEEVIARDLDAFKERGVHIVSLESGYDMGYPYLSEGWFKLVQKTVALAKERDMRVWIVDEGKYPSGFAGGKFTTDAPELRMKALVKEEEIELKTGETISRELSDAIVSAVAFNSEDNSNQIIEIQSGKLEWTAPEGNWKVLLVKHDFRSSPTRAVNNLTRGKDPSNSLCDYLDTLATQKFIEFTHAEHEKYVGEEFGKTVLGFRGDEPDYSIRGIPWTTAIFDKFKEIKGYDVQPYVAAFFTPELTDEQKRVKADYWDVWSTMFSENFFKVQSDWCGERNVQYLVHLNREDKMLGLVHHEGDFFKDMRYPQMPGVDAIWNQIWPDSLVTDFPKYASSAAHVFGKPRSFTESFAAYRKEPTVEQAKWVLDHQFVRGINMVEVMFVPASTNGELGLANWTADERFADYAKYIHRSAYLLSQGQPAAKIAVYHPTTSMYMDDEKSNETTLKVMQQLLENQRDFDFIDEYALSTGLKLDDDKLINLSGQAYEAVLVPSASVISKSSLERLQAFVSEGGEVVFIGRTPSVVVEKTFLDAAGAPDLSWAAFIDSDKIDEAVLAKLPAAEVSFDKKCPDVKYTHRKLQDGELYFFFNEGNEKQTLTAKIEGSGQQVQYWDAMSARMMKMKAETIDDGILQIDLELDKWESKFIVVCWGK